MKLFLSVPFTSRALPDKSLDPAYETLIRDLLSGLRDSGHEVFCALEHAHYSFGGLTPPEEEFEQDLAAIDSSDVMIVMLEERVSSGIQLELGYAYAKGIELDMFQVGKPTWSNIGFSKLSGKAIEQVLDEKDFALKVLEKYR